MKNRDVTVEVKYGNKAYTRIVRMSDPPSLLSNLSEHLRITVKELKADITREVKRRLKRRSK